MHLLLIKMNIRNLLPIIGILLFLYIIIDIGIENIVNSLVLISPIYLVIGLLLIIPRVFLSSYKWFIICKKQRINIRLFYIIKIFLISVFYGFITPASIGGFISIFYIKKKAKVTWEKSITNSLLDGSTELIAGLFLALIGSIILLEYHPSIFPSILIIFLLILTLFILLLKKEKAEVLFKFFIRPFIPEKLKTKVDESIESFYEDIPRLGELLTPFLLEYVVWIIMGVQVYLIALNFSIDISFYHFLFIYMISFIAGVIPISIGGLGIREGTLVLLLLVFGVSPQVSFVISLIGYILTNLIPGIVGWGLSIHLKPDVEKMIVK